MYTDKTIKYVRRLIKDGHLDAGKLQNYHDAGISTWFLFDYAYPRFIVHISNDLDFDAQHKLMDGFNYVICVQQPYWDPFNSPQWSLVRLNWAEWEPEDIKRACRWAK